VVVIGDGIATEENLKHLREKNLESICVRRSNLSEYSIVGSEPVTVLGNRNNPIRTANHFFINFMSYFYVFLSKCKNLTLSLHQKNPIDFLFFTKIVFYKDCYRALDTIKNYFYQIYFTD
jgi:hypothetical protein